jgi:hypothetical protein
MQSSFQFAIAAKFNVDLLIKRETDEIQGF